MINYPITKYDRLPLYSLTIPSERKQTDPLAFLPREKTFPPIDNQLCQHRLCVKH